MERDKQAKDATETLKSVPCAVTSNAKDGEPEVKVDNWPPKLVMQLLPKALISNIGGGYLKNSTSVVFHPSPCPALDALTKVMSGNFAGCIQFNNSNSPDGNLKVLILLYAADKKVYLGFIANDQTAFVERFRSLIQQRKNNQIMRKTPAGSQGSSTTGSQTPVPGDNVQRLLPGCMTPVGFMSNLMNGQQSHMGGLVAGGSVSQTSKNGQSIFPLYQNVNLMNQMYAEGKAYMEKLYLNHLNAPQGSIGPTMVAGKINSCNVINGPVALPGNTMPNRYPSTGHSMETTVEAALTKNVVQSIQRANATQLVQDYLNRPQGSTVPPVDAMLTLLNSHGILDAKPTGQPQDPIMAMHRNTVPSSGIVVNGALAEMPSPPQENMSGISQLGLASAEVKQEKMESQQSEIEDDFELI
ncbi:mediator of RNA polymerase II transcription subunit 25-like [Planococcus citri]|uniref:mediator of RNA polymerase II transcription subunit 25-like n=1 Tax=Planococcus citri TaxID=170843 RepID=UPI0031FA34AD